MDSYKEPILKHCDKEKLKRALSLVDKLKRVNSKSDSWRKTLVDLAYDYKLVNGWQHRLTDEEFEFIRNVFLSQAENADASLDRIKNSRKRSYLDSEEIALSENLACEAEMNLVHFEEQHRKVPLSEEEIALSENLACEAEMNLVHFEEQHMKVPLSEEEIALNEMWWPPLK
jgi:acyl-CoA thioesterase FadM